MSPLCTVLLSMVWFPVVSCNLKILNRKFQKFLSFKLHAFLSIVDEILRQRALSCPGQESSRPAFMLCMVSDH
jgi:hypothetical protein